MLFTEMLATLPPIDHLAAIDLMRADGTVERIENRSGSAGSVAVYHALWQQFGVLNREAAAQGLLWFAEHSDHARHHPGHHPNIDRLLQLLDSGEVVALNPVGRA